MELEDFATPALLLNVDALERNLGRMADDCRAAAIVAETGGLRLAGLQGYEGHCQHVFEPEERRRRAFEAYERLLATRALVEDAGLRVPWVTTAGTGTFRLAIEHGVATEVQPGS